VSYLYISITLFFKLLLILCKWKASDQTDVTANYNFHGLQKGVKGNLDQMYKELLIYAVF